MGWITKRCWRRRSAIPKGEVSGSVDFTITPIADGDDSENNEIIALKGTIKNPDLDLDVPSLATITLKDTPKPEPEDGEEPEDGLGTGRHYTGRHYTCFQ